MGRRYLLSIFTAVCVLLLLALPICLVNIGHDPTTPEHGTRDTDWELNEYPPDVTAFIPQPSPVLNHGNGYTILGVDGDDQDINNGENVTTVVVDLTPVGGAADTDMLDDGLGDDLLANDDVFTLNISIPLDFPPGTYYLPVKVTDNGTVPGPLFNDSQNITLIIAQYNRGCGYGGGWRG